MTCGLMLKICWNAITLHVRYTYIYKYYMKYIKDVRNIYLIIGIIKNLGNVANRKIFLFCLNNICNKCKHNNLPLVEAQLQCFTIYVLIIEQGTSSNFSNYFHASATLPLWSLLIKAGVGIWLRHCGLCVPEGKIFLPMLFLIGVLGVDLLLNGGIFSSMIGCFGRSKFDQLMRKVFGVLGP